jgi:hypothetical protein
LHFSFYEFIADWASDLCVCYGRSFTAVAGNLFLGTVVLGSLLCSEISGVVLHTLCQLYLLWGPQWVYHSSPGSFPTEVIGTDGVGVTWSPGMFIFSIACYVQQRIQL